MTDITGPVHLVGIGGIHMSAIAQLLMQRGVTVSGHTTSVQIGLSRAPGPIDSGQSPL